MIIRFLEAARSLLRKTGYFRQRAKGFIQVKKTPLSVKQVRNAFVDACDVLGIDATMEFISMLVAHSALETGHWKHLRCYNFGNVKATDAWINNGGKYTYYEASEILKPDAAQRCLRAAAPRTDGAGLNVEFVKKLPNGDYVLWFWPEHREARFRAFDNMEQGAYAYLAKLNGRYRKAFQYALVGDANKYARALHKFGYFTANVDKYSEVLQKLYKRYHSQLYV